MNSLTPDTLAFAFLWYVAFLFSTTCHEAAHALAARLGGDPTAYHGGQVTLNPLPHIEREPWGMVVIPLISFFIFGWVIGWASAPYDPLWQRRYPRRAAWMALAGPAANLLIMLLAAAGVWLGVRLGHLRHPTVAQIGGAHGVVEAVNPEQFGFLAAFLGVFFILNLLLGTFNLLPLPPLDGHAGITLALSEKQALRVMEFGQDRSFHVLGTLIAWYVFGKIIPVVFLLGLKLLYPSVTYT
jgi:Zn-dependent protease